MKHLKIVLNLLYELGSWCDQFVCKALFSIAFSCVAVPFLFIGRLLNIYFFFDIAFLEIVCIFLTASLIMGARKHWIMKDFSGRALMVGLIEQTAIVGVAMVVCNAFMQLKEFNHNEGIRDYFNAIYKTSILVYLGISIFTSMSVITKGKFPPVGWLRRMKSFNNTLDIKDLTGKP